MSTTNRLINMVLRGHADKFKTVLQEELKERASVIMEEIYRVESSKILEQVDTVISETVKEQVVHPKVEPEVAKFLPENTYQLRDGGVGILDQTERQLVSKLYESLNNNNKERLVKLLSESQESFNKVLKLAKTQAKK